MWIERMESNSVRMERLCISEIHPVNSCGRTMSSPMAPPRSAGILQSWPTGSSVELTGLLWTLPDGCMWPPASVSRYSVRKASISAQFPPHGKSPRSLSQDLIRRPFILSGEALTDPAARALTRGPYTGSRCWRKVSKAAPSNLRTDPCQLCFRAFPDDREKAIEVVLAYEWVWTARLTEIQSMKFIERLVVERMQGQVNIGVGLRCGIVESLCRGTPGFERFFHVRKISDSVAPHIGIDTTPDGPDVPLVSIL